MPYHYHIVVFGFKATALSITYLSVVDVPGVRLLVVECLQTVFWEPA